MKTQTVAKTLFLLATLLTAAIARAQTDYDRTDMPREQYGALAGSNEFMIGGSGASNKHLDDSLGGLNFSVGHYLTNAQEVLIRQSVNYNNPQNSKQSWNGSTRLAFDQFIIPHGALRPFVGINIGGVYGDNVRDTWAAGLEVGAKYYVLPRTFVEVTAEYAWYFQHARSINNVRDSFDTGQWNWGVGVGFNF